MPQQLLETVFRNENELEPEKEFALLYLSTFLNNLYGLRVGIHFKKI